MVVSFLVNSCVRSRAFLSSMPFTMPHIWLIMPAHASARKLPAHPLGAAAGVDLSSADHDTQET